MRLIIVFLAIFCLSGCNTQDLLNKFVSVQDQATARQYIDDLRTNNLAPIETAIDPSIMTPTTHSILVQLASEMPPHDPTSVKIVGAHSYKDISMSVAATTWEYQFGEKWFIVDITIQNKNGIKTITGLHVTPIAQSLEAQNRFTFSGKGIWHYIFLVLAVLVVAITLIALITCIRTPNFRRKWLWIIFIVFGFGRLSLNWTTGHGFFTPIAFQLFSASAVAELYGPWIISISLPVGAVIFLVRHNDLRKPGGAG